MPHACHLDPSGEGALSERRSTSSSPQSAAGARICVLPPSTIGTDHLFDLSGFEEEAKS